MPRATIPYKVRVASMPSICATMSAADCVGKMDWDA